MRGGQLQLLAQRHFQLAADVLVFLEEDAGVFAALAQAFSAVTNPRAALFEKAFINAEIDQVALARDAFAVDDVEFGFAEGRGHFVLNDFGAGARTDHLVAFLDGLNAANVHAHGSIKLQRASARGSLRIAEHYANLFADLVDEDEAGVGLGDNGGEFAQRLRHKAGLQTHLRIAHVPFEFGLGDESGDGVDYNDVDAPGADQRFGNFERLLAVVGLGDEQVVDIDAEFAGVDGIERVFRVDERRLSAELLRFCDHVQGHGGFAAGFRAINLDYATARESANTQRGVNGEASAGDYADRHQHVAAAQPHDGSFTVRLFNLGYRCFEKFRFVVSHFTPR